MEHLGTFHKGKIHFMHFQISKKINYDQSQMKSVTVNLFISTTKCTTTLLNLYLFIQECLVDI